MLKIQALGKIKLHGFYFTLNEYREIFAQEIYQALSKSKIYTAKKLSII